MNTEIFKMLILGIIQGITEFLPISSSGHIALFESLLNYKISVSQELILNAGTLLAIILYFNKDLIKFLIPSKDNTIKFYNFILPKMPILLIIGSIPAIIFALVLGDFIEKETSYLMMIGIMMIIIALFMFLAEKYFQKVKSLKQISVRDSIIIGFFQAIALVRGTSRSGISISAGYLRGLNAEASTNFSFLLGLPVIGGGVLLGIIKLSKTPISNSELGLLTVGFFASLFSGILAMKLLISVVKTKGLKPFVIYRIIAGLTIIIYSLIK